MTEQDARAQFGDDARKVEGFARGADADPLDDRLRQMAAEVVAGRYVEMPLELARVVYLEKCTERAALAKMRARCKVLGIAFLVHERHVGFTKAKVLVFFPSPSTLATPERRDTG